MPAGENTKTASVNPLKKFQKKEDIEAEFMASGEQERLNEIIIKRLQEEGWTAKVEEICQEYIRSKVNFELCFG